MGLFLDMKFRVDNIRRYLLYEVTKARDYIYRLAHGITSTAVENLLKPTSSIPIQVCVTNVVSDLDAHAQLECLCSQAWRGFRYLMDARSRLYA